MFFKTSKTFICVQCNIDDKQKHRCIYTFNKPTKEFYHINNF